MDARHVFLIMVLLILSGCNNDNSGRAHETGEHSHEEDHDDARLTSIQDRARDHELHHIHTHYEEAFLAEMIAHHEDAINGSRDALASENQNLSNLAAAIITQHSIELGILKDYMKELYPNSMHLVTYEPIVMDYETEGSDFNEVDYLIDMVENHEQGIEMIYEVIHEDESLSSDVRKFSEYMINNLEYEIVQLEELLSTYSNHMHTESEEQFLADMVLHHQEAVDTSLIISTTKDEALKDLAQKIYASQQAEIKMMNEWFKEWYPNSNYTPHYHEMMPPLEGLEENERNIAYLGGMIEHHEMAVHMLKELILLDPHPELKAMAEQMIMVQQSEIHDMREILAGYKSDIAGTDAHEHEEGHMHDDSHPH